MIVIQPSFENKMAIISLGVIFFKGPYIPHFISAWGSKCENNLQEVMVCRL